MVVFNRETRGGLPFVNANFIIKIHLLLTIDHIANSLKCWFRRSVIDIKHPSLSLLFDTRVSSQLMYLKPDK